MKKDSFRGISRFFAALFPQGLPGRKRPAFFIGFVAATFCTGAALWPMGERVFGESKNPPKQIQAQTDAQLLEGRWVRPDGGYVLDLSEIKKDGSLKASYFNPRPIKVFTATWGAKEGKINLFVELRDVNYPGSKYNLQYDPGSDRLKGTYFQAVEKQTYNIEFVRAK